MFTITEVENFIHETFNNCFGKEDVKKGHVEGQRNYLAGVIDTLCRVGKITEETRQLYHLCYYENIPFVDLICDDYDMGVDQMVIKKNSSPTVKKTDKPLDNSL